MKPFQPTSSFGSKLADELGPVSPPLPPPQPQSQQQQQQQQPLGTQSTGFNPFRGSTLPPLNGTLNGGVGLQSQQTGMGTFGIGGGAGGGAGNGFGSFGGAVQQQPSQQQFGAAGSLI